MGAVRFANSGLELLLIIMLSKGVKGVTNISHLSCKV